MGPRENCHVSVGYCVRTALLSAALLRLPRLLNNERGRGNTHAKRRALQQRALHELERRRQQRGGHGLRQARIRREHRVAQLQHGGRQLQVGVAATTYPRAHLRTRSDSSTHGSGKIPPSCHTHDEVAKDEETCSLLSRSTLRCVGCGGMQGCGAKRAHEMSAAASVMIACRPAAGTSDACGGSHSVSQQPVLEARALVASGSPFSTLSVRRDLGSIPGARRTRRASAWR